MCSRCCPPHPELVELGRVAAGGADGAAARHGVTITATVDLAEGLAAGPTAVYAFNDELALGARPALPEGTALIGTDDSPAARLAHPRLTTIALGTHARRGRTSRSGCTRWSRTRTPTGRRSSSARRWSSALRPSDFRTVA